MWTKQDIVNALLLVGFFVVVAYTFTHLGTSFGR